MGSVFSDFQASCKLETVCHSSFVCWVNCYFTSFPQARGFLHICGFFPTFLWILPVLNDHCLTKTEMFSVFPVKSQPTSVSFILLSKFLACHQIVLFYDKTSTLFILDSTCNLQSTGRRGILKTLLCWIIKDIWQWIFSIYSLINTCFRSVLCLISNSWMWSVSIEARVPGSPVQVSSLPGWTLCYLLPVKWSYMNS